MVSLQSTPSQISKTSQREMSDWLKESEEIYQRDRASGKIQMCGSADPPRGKIYML